MREMKAILPDILSTKGLIVKAPTCQITRDPLERSSSGFINTSRILEKAEHSSIDDTGEDSNEYIKDDTFPNNDLMNVEEDSKKSEFLTAKVEDNHNICQSKDVNEYKITKVWASAEASDSVFMPRDQEMIDEIEGSEISNT